MFGRLRRKRSAPPPAPEARRASPGPPATAAEPLQSPKQVLQRHPVFAAWSAEDRALLAGHCKVISAGPGEPLLAVASTSPFIHFLLDGAVRLEAADGFRQDVEAGSKDACFPIARLRPAVYAMTSLAPSRLLLIEQSALRRLGNGAPRPSRARFDPFAPVVDGSWRAHPVVAQIERALRDGTLELPVIPGVALKVRRALTREDYELSDISRIITADPVISARLLKLANSVAFRGQVACESLHGAVLRLGALRVQHLVLALASSALFRTSEAAIKTRLNAIWRHLVEVASLCASLARLEGTLSPDTALLTGLLHEIGKIPILQQASRHPDLLERPGLLDDILAGLGPVVSAATLRQWQLGADFVQAAELQHSWSYDHDGTADYVDLLLVAHVHALTRQEQDYALPRLDETPAFSRITGKRLSGAESLAVLRAAEDETKALRQLLR